VVSTLLPALRSFGSARRTRRLLAIALALALAISLGTGPTRPAKADVSTDSATPVLWGEFGNSKPQLLEREQTYGRSFGTYRVYKRWDQGITADMLWGRDNGRIPLLSIKAESASGLVSFNSIATAQPGSATYSRITAWGTAIKNYAGPIYVIFNHEPDASFSRGSGNAAQFVAAWRKLVTTWRGQGVTNAKYVFTTTAWGFRKKASDPTASTYYYPGDAYVDDIGGDGYNWYRCADRTDGWTELSTIIEGLRQFGTAHPSKGLMLPEWGSMEDPQAVGTHKAQWVRNAATLLSQPAYAQFVGMTGWGGAGNCPMNFNTSAAARQAYIDMGQLPKFSSRSFR
jgi:hypothetical protein